LFNQSRLSVFVRFRAASKAIQYGQGWTRMDKPKHRQYKSIVLYKLNPEKKEIEQNLEVVYCNRNTHIYIYTHTNTHIHAHLHTHARSVG
jgi:hypothetical protein